MEGKYALVRRAPVVLGLFLTGMVLILGNNAISIAGALPESQAPGELAAMEKTPASEEDAKPCGKPIPCAVNNPPLPGDKASDGTQCISGAACRKPGAGCGPGAMTNGRCTTINNGGGNCSCGCVY